MRFPGTDKTKVLFSCIPGSRGSLTMKRRIISLLLAAVLPLALILPAAAEAVADLGAMACILRMAARTPGFDYDLFFRTYAKVHCVKYVENHLENMFRHEEHPMDHLRVNMVVSQFPEFRGTYHIQPGDGMYVAPADSIGVWGMN